MNEKLMQDNLEELEKLVSTLPDKEAVSIDEIEALDASIKQYEEEVKTLSEKLSNQDNYQRQKSDFEVHERPIIEQLLQESIATQQQEIEDEITKYQRLQNEQQKYLEEYKKSVEKVQAEIEEIQRKLYKNEVAQKRNYNKLVLSDKELDSLEKELVDKQELLELGTGLIEICENNISSYSKNITECNEKMLVLNKKEEKLNGIVSSKKDYMSDVDKYAVRLDEDKLTKLESGLTALKNQKAFLETDTKKLTQEKIAEIRESIDELSSQLATERTNNKNLQAKIEELNKTIQDKENENKLLMEENKKTKEKEPQVKEESNVNQVEQQTNESHKVTKITSAKEFLKKHKKAILIAAGVTAVALTAQPYIIPAIMHANSVLWTSAPALRSFLHGCNLVLGKTIGASYVGSTGLWTAANGALINAGVANASLLGALTVQATTIGVIGKSAKKLIEKIKDKFEKKQKNDEPEKEEIILTSNEEENEKNTPFTEDETLQTEMTSSTMDNKINLSDLTKVQSNKDAEVDVNPTIEHLQELKNQLKNNKTNLYDSEYYKYIDDDQDLLKEEGGMTL